MDEKFQYRLSENQKAEIAQNLIDILQKDSEITPPTREFVYIWIRQPDGQGREKAFYDVWDIVLKNYMPETRPILFRSCIRRSGDEKIASFTGRLECARRISKGRGSLIVCDTKEELLLEEQYYQPGQYKHTFYPLVSVLEKAKTSGRWGFTEDFLTEFIGEDEYIMRINLGSMHCFRWIKNDY